LRLGRRRWGPKTQAVFGVSHVRAMKNPARFPGPGLGTLLKDIFLYMSSVSTSRSHKLHRGHKCTTQRLYSASREIFVGHPTVGVRPMKNPARFPGRAWTHFQACSFVLESRSSSIHPIRLASWNRSTSPGLRTTGAARTAAASHAPFVDVWAPVRADVRTDQAALRADHSAAQGAHRGFVRQPVRIECAAVMTSP
jgi:hypothetical protein